MALQGTGSITATQIAVELGYTQGASTRIGEYRLNGGQDFTQGEILTIGDFENNELDFREYFKVGTSQYWDTHYNFGKNTKKGKKKISNSFLNLLIINTIIPLKFAYNRYKGAQDNEGLFKMMAKIKKEEKWIMQKE